MMISLDTNVWIFGLFGNDPFCERILGNLSKFDVVVPNQVRKELENNLPKAHLKRFYQIVRRSNIQLNFEVVPTIYITTFKEKGIFSIKGENKQVSNLLYGSPPFIEKIRKKA